MNDKNHSVGISRHVAERFIFASGWKVFSWDEEGSPMSFWDGIVTWRGYGWLSAYREILERTRQMEMFKNEN